jgi:hypothetical protein
MEQKDYAVCAFYMRENAGMHREGMKYKYTLLWIEGRERDGKLYTMHPPLVGDTLPLSDDTQDIHDTFQVVMRDFSYSRYGSANWPLGEKHSSVGPHITYIVVRSTGVFRDEVSEIGNP